MFSQDFATRRLDLVERRKVEIVLVFGVGQLQLSETGDEHHLPVPRT